MQVSFSLEQLLQFAVSAKLHSEDGSVGLTLNPLPMASQVPANAHQNADNFQGITIHFEFGATDVESTHMVSVHASCAPFDQHLSQVKPHASTTASQDSSSMNQSSILEPTQDTHHNIPDISTLASTLTPDAQIASHDSWNDIATAVLDGVQSVQRWPSFPATLPQYTWPNDPILHDNAISAASFLATSDPQYENDTSYHSGASTPFDFGRDLANYFGDMLTTRELEIHPKFSQSTLPFMSRHHVPPAKDGQTISSDSSPVSNNISSNLTASPDTTYPPVDPSSPASTSTPSSSSSHMTRPPISLPFRDANTSTKRRRKKQLHLQEAREDA
uniref:Uncharacterized protein n=1 Tax=Moniliophthora roreri TaxID=221103 RepID=A0A0W0GEL7_MONRR